MIEQDSTELSAEETIFEIDIEEMEQMASPGVVMAD
jgi:hypothetical protein